ncbi:hypothetical protein ONZ45_g1530 [Pleurotus djamor]|nr:hypothetical protein ONZ45_g1530 [Pleurotus djamor]
MSTSPEAPPPTIDAATKPVGDVDKNAAPTLNPFDDASPDDDGDIVLSKAPGEPASSSTTAIDASSSSTSRTPVIFDEPTPMLPQRPQPQIEETHADPRVAALQAMFPTFDDLVLQSVLESVNWDQDRAIDMLLGMSDPEYKPETRPSQPPATDLDEQFARQLFLDEQRAQQASWQAAHPAPPGGGRRSSMQPVYQVNPQAPQQGPQNQGLISADLQQQFTKVAEAGKKTFNNIFSKVKAKMQEFDSPARSDQSTTQPTWGAPSSSQQYYGGNNYATSQQPPATQQPVPQQVPLAQQPAYYDPNPERSPSISPQPSPIPAASPPPAAVSNPWMTSTSTSQPSQLPGTDPTSRASPGPGGGSVPIDGNKLGLLPKRPVSLLRPETGSGAPTQMQRQESTDDDLEYVENPFEEGNRK